MSATDLRAFIEQSSLAMAMFDREMRYIAVSQRWLSERDLDISILGRSAYDVFPAAEEKFRSAHLRALSGETITPTEDHFETARGKVHWVRSRIIPWRCADGQIGGVLVFAEDITAQRRAEELLRESEERYRYAVDAASDGIWDWNLKTDHVTYSPAYYRMLGYEASEWQAGCVTSWIDLLHPDDRERIVTLARELLVSPGSYQLEFRLRAKDGSYHWIVSRGKAVERDESGAPIRAVGTHTDVSDRKANEQALRLNAELLRQQNQQLDAIYQNAPIGLAFFDKQMRIRRINQRLAEIGGPPPEAYIGRTIGETVPTMAALIEEAGKAVLAKGTPIEGRELSGETPAYPGVTRYFVDNWYPIFGEGGEISGCGVVVDETTDRKMIERELRQTSERLTLAQSAAEIGIWDWDLGANQAYVNDEYYQILGLPRGTSISYDDFLELLHPEDRSEYETLVQEAFSGGRRIDAECRIIRKNDGAIRWLRSKGEILSDMEGRAVRAMGAVWDITPLKEGQTALLQRSEDRYQRIVETALEGVWMLDRESKTSFVNARMAEMLGYTAEEMLGRAIYEFMTDEWKGIAQKKLSSRRAGVAETYDFKYQRKDGSHLWALLSARPIYENGDYVGALGMVVDITERKRLEDELRLNMSLLEEQARQAQAANEAKSEFLAKMSHEIRTPLNGVIGAAQLLEREKLSPDQRKLTRQIDDSGCTLMGIINDILDFSKIEAGQLVVEREPFALESALKNVKNLLGPSAQSKQLTFEIVCAPGTCSASLLGDVLRLEQVLVNLVGNAIKFTERGGVRVFIHPIAQTPLSVRLRFEVRDSGIGVGAGKLSALFDPFVQADASITRRFGGTGLGLSICKRLVELMGGVIGVESSEGAGSTFWFELPFDMAIPETPLGPPGSPPAPREERRLSGLHCLIVDDTRVNRMVIEQMLISEGARVTLTVDGQQAVQVLKAGPAEFHAVLMDVQMPVMDGLAATRAIRTELGLTDLPVIALTAGVLPEQRQRALDAGCDDFIAKPISLEELVEKLTAHVPRRGA